MGVEFMPALSLDAPCRQSMPSAAISSSGDQTGLFVDHHPHCNPAGRGRTMQGRAGTYNDSDTGETPCEF
jgi:hypothetical protein